MLGYQQMIPVMSMATNRGRVRHKCQQSARTHRLSLDSTCWRSGCGGRLWHWCSGLSRELAGDVGDPPEPATRHRVSTPPCGTGLKHRRLMAGLESARGRDSVF